MARQKKKTKASNWLNPNQPDCYVFRIRLQVDRIRFIFVEIFFLLKIFQIKNRFLFCNPADNNVNNKLACQVAV